MSNVSKCFSCVHKNDYDPKFGYYGCNLSGQECKGYSMFEPKVKPKPITNADRIRAMSDEELAHFMTPENYKFPCPPNHIDCQYELIPCWMCWARWLKAPVKAEEGKADDS